MATEKITQAHLALLASKVMDDVPEGGGGPSPNIIPSGKSNTIFDDIRQVDRAGGNLSLRQVFLAVRSSNREKAMGAHMIVARPPGDRNVSIVLMDSVDDFATRSQDISRLGSGFLVSGMYHGQLFGNHMQQQGVLMIMQREEAELPVIGARMVLVYREGFADEYMQYVSVLRITTNVVRTFEDAQGEFKRRIISVELGQTLARNYPGFDAQRQTITTAALRNATSIRTTVWAPIAKYYGTKRLTQDGVATLHSHVQCEGIYERIVPSSEVETPIPSSRINGQVNALMQVGNWIDFNVNRALNASTVLYIGAAVTPGSLAICPVANESQLVTDAGGSILYGGVQVGFIDYANGLVTPNTNIFTAQQLRVKYAPAVEIPSDITSIGIGITAENRRQNFVVTLPFSVVRRTLQAHFCIQKVWYVLTEDGAGAVTDGDPAHGAGNFSHATRTLSLTLPGLPDVNSAVIITYVVDTATLDASGFVDMQYGRFVIPLNSDGQISLDDGSKPFEPGAVHIKWDVDGTAYDAWDNGRGVLTGAGAGAVNYQGGRLILMPAVLPPRGTVLVVTTVQHNRTAQPVTWATTTDSYTTTLPEPPRPGTLRIPFSLPLRAGTQASGYAHAQSERTIAGYVTDDGQGALVFEGVEVGTVDYDSGAIAITIDQAAANALGAGVQFDLTRVTDAMIN